MKHILFSILFISFGYSISAQSSINTFSNSPKDVKFYTEDVERFWTVFDENYLKFKGKAFQLNYIDKGSIGLKGFLKNRITSGKFLAKTVKKNLSYYEAIRKTSMSIDNYKDSFYKTFFKLKELYPNAVFPDVYFVIGAKNSGGTIFNRGLVIGLERFGTPNENFKPDINIESLNNLIAHELIHFQQNYGRNNSLLAKCIREGAGDFLGEKISGKIHTNSKTYDYGNANEVSLKEEFLERKDTNNWHEWLYYSKDKSRPKDLGYWIGYKICEAYYNQTSDKEQAIYEILNIDDFDSFLDKSDYFNN